MTKASEDPGMAAESLKALIELGADACCEHCKRGNWPGHFDDLLAEVERAAAVRALEEFAEQWATRDGIEALMFATDDVSAVQITEKALLARAEAYRRERKE